MPVCYDDICLNLFFFVRLRGGEQGEREHRNIRKEGRKENERKRRRGIRRNYNNNNKEKIINRHTKEYINKVIYV